jgi:hypothetical protein
MKNIVQKNSNFSLLNTLIFITVMLIVSASFSQQVSVTIAASGSWTPPAGVTSIQVEAWGGGGGGGGSTGSSGRAGGGGAGGGYVKNTTVAVTPGTPYSITVGSGGVAGTSNSASVNGTAGTNTTATFGSVTITATGGGAGSGGSSGTPSGAGGLGSAASNLGFSGTFSYSGGNGAAGTSGTRSGGGGGAAGELSNGGTASASAVTGGMYGGSNASPYGIGANGNSTTNGSPGQLPGGGGAGGYTTSTTGKAGGAGAPGQMIITYTPTTPTITLSASTLTGFATSTNSVSTSQFINVRGANLTADIIIIPSTNFEISTSSSSGFGSSLIIPYGSGTVSSTPIYVRIKSGASNGLLSETISFASTGATQQSLSCSGTVVTNYYYKGTGSIATLSNWGTNTDGTGTIPPDFGSTTNYQAFIIVNAAAITTNSSWTIGAVASSVTKLILGDSGKPAVSLTIGSGFPITLGTNVKLDLAAASSGSNEVIFQDTTPPLLGTIDSSANITYANGSTGITGTPCNTLKITTNTAVALTSTPNCKYLILDYGSSIVAPSSYYITILSGGNAIINGSISGARSQGIFTTDAANKGTIYGVDLNTPITLGVNSTVIYNRTSAQIISPLNYANLSVMITGTGTLSANATLSGTLTVGTGATLATGGFLTLKSNADGTARVAPVLGSITGNVTVERYIPAKRAWRALTAPVSTTTSIFANWQENGANSGAGNGINGFDIWSNSGGTGIISGGSGSSLLSYNSSTNNWSGITDTTTSSSLLSGSVNKPFMAFVTGPYGSGNVTSGATATTIRATGALFTGNQTYACTATQYTFIGNPYASPLDPALMLNDTDNAAFGGNIWVWDANATGSNTVGTYNLFNSGTYTNVTSNPVVTSGTQIQSGQAFFVKSAAGGTFTIKEAHKGTTFSNAVFRTAAPELLRVGLYKQVNNEWSGRDGAMTVILSDAAANQSPNKMANSTENIAFTKNGASFASNHHLPLVASDVLNVKVWNTTAGANYKLKLNTEEFSATNLEATLEDLFTNSRTPLTLDGSAVEYPFTVTTEALSTGDRFRIVFQTSALGMNNPKANGFSIVPNPVTGDSFQVNLGSLATGIYSYTICNAIGQEVEKGSIQNATQNTNYEVKMSNAATGVYIMKIKGSDNSVFTAKIIKK